MKAPRLCLLLCLAAVPTLAWGQHVLLVNYHGRAQAVVDADGLHPVVFYKGKLRETDIDRFNLVKGGAYLPLFVSLRQPKLVSSSESIIGDTQQLNRQFNFSCELESGYALKHVFLVVTFTSDLSDKGLLLYGVGDLKPNQSHRVNVFVPTEMRSEPGKFQVYLFSGGRELFQSMMPMGLREAALDKIVFERIKGVRNSPPRPLLGPAPEYPADLRAKKVVGQATVSFVIRPNGSVGDPKVVNTSRPEFGKAAVAAIRMWRFLPKIKDGRPVASRAELPFDFNGH